MQLLPSGAASRDDRAQTKTATPARSHRPSVLTQLGMLCLAGGHLAQAASQNPAGLQAQGQAQSRALRPAQPLDQALPKPQQNAGFHQAATHAGTVSDAVRPVPQEAMAQDPLMRAAALFAMPDAVLAEASKYAYSHSAHVFDESAVAFGQENTVITLGEAGAKATGIEAFGLKPFGSESRRSLKADTHALARRQRRGSMRRETQRYELVLSRYNEKLEWLRDLPDFWRITIYNTGTNDTPVWSDRPLDVVPLQNQKFGREGYAYAHHISTRYATLADYTVFSQAAPFEHNPNFGSMLPHPAMLTLVQAMSTMFTDTIPPRVIRDRFSPDPWFRPDKFSLRTMDSLFFEDCCIYTAGLAYSARFNVTEGSNLVNHLLTSIGLPNYIPEASEVGVFPYGGMFGVAKRQIQQHPRDVYQRLVPKLLEHIQVGYIMERTWLILFGGKAFLE